MTTEGFKNKIIEAGDHIQKLIFEKKVTHVYIDDAKLILMNRHGYSPISTFWL